MKNKQVINRWTCRLALAGVSLLGLPLFAQDVENLDEGEIALAPIDQSADKPEGLPVKVSSGVSEQFNSDIDSGGSFSITRFKVGAASPIHLSDDFVLNTSLRYSLDSYTFDGISAPWHNINTLTVASVLSWRLDDTWTVYGGGFARWSEESGAAWGDGATGGGLIGFNYKMNDTLTLGAGLALVSVLEDDATVLPLITVKWNFADDWRLDVGLTDVATLGYGAKVTWLFDKQLEFGGGAQFHKSRFRLDTADGVGQEQSTAIFIDATWHALSMLDLNAYFGIAAGGQLRVETSTGKKVGESDYDPAPMLGLNATVKF